jgi:hypothetical protein
VQESTDSFWNGGYHWDEVRGNSDSDESFGDRAVEAIGCFGKGFTILGGITQEGLNYGR